MKKKLALLLLFLFSLYLSDIQLIGFQSEGKEFLFAGKGKFNNGKFKEAIEVLNKAISSGLTDKEKIESHLYLGVCFIALNEIDEGKKHFKEIIKIEPEYIFDKESFPPEIKNIFSETKYQFPVVYDFNSLPEIFYPYKEEKQYFHFQLTYPDCINFSITSNYQNILKDRKCFKTSGFQSYEWSWRDELINMNKINISLIPDKNKNEYSFHKKIKLEVEMPDKLLFYNNRFQIEGLKLLPETKIKTTYPDLPLWTGISVLFGFGAYTFFTESPENDNYYYRQENTKTKYIVTGVLCGILAVTSLIKAFTPKKMEVSNKRNIDKNIKLKKEIRRLKEKIKVKQKINH